MTSPRLLFVPILSIVLSTSCSNSSETEARRSVSKKPGQGADGSGDQSGGSALDCEGQWALAVKQQPIGAVFVYSSAIKLGISKVVDRVETVTAASASSITRNIKVEDQLINQYVPGLSSQSLTLSKDKFIQTCDKAGGQPVTVTGLGGDITVKGQSDDVVTIASKQIAVKRIDIKATGVKLGSYTVSADVVTYISPRFPALPLKQQITVTDSTESVIKGATIEDTLKSGLPTE